MRTPHENYSRSTVWARSSLRLVRAFLVLPPIYFSKTKFAGAARALYLTVTRGSRAANGYTA